MSKVKVLITNDQKKSKGTYWNSSVDPALLYGRPPIGGTQR